MIIRKKEHFHDLLDVQNDDSMDEDLNTESGQIIEDIEILLKHSLLFLFKVR